ncbi:MAG: hypothetical protein H7A25_01105 [Leptospiraceae bacterium]|nr:hypothetical protein [Leptospiraceae bacterium]MCP5498473.1 hypothetical protein [Leptospiraceae bacterium]
MKGSESSLKKALCTFIFFFYICTGLISANENREKFEEILQKAELELKRRDSKKTLNLLSQVSTQIPLALEWKFYRLRGLSYRLEKDLLLAGEDLEKSIRLKKEQPDLFLELANIYRELARPKKEFSFLKLYLSQNKNSPEERFRATLLSSRLGDKKYFTYSIQEIKQFEIPEFQGKCHPSIKPANMEALVPELKRLEEKNQWFCVRELAKFYLPYFPLQKEIHSYIIRSERKLKVPYSEQELSLIQKASLFPEMESYSLQLALFYKKNKKPQRALQLFRRAFLQTLLRRGHTFSAEVLSPIRDYYYQQRRHTDIQAIDKILELRKMEAQKRLEALDSNLIQFHENREFLLFSLFILKEEQKQNKFEEVKNRFIIRDEKYGMRELIGALGLFSFKEEEKLLK